MKRYAAIDIGSNAVRLLIADIVTMGKKISFRKNNLNFKKIELIYLIIKNNIYSNLKIKKIMSNNYLPLNILLIKPFLNFLYYLRHKFTIKIIEYLYIIFLFIISDMLNS